MTGRKRKEGGFAMLLVFLMAAVIAITLYKEIPRIAFDEQREKEQLLIDRGQQYQRAIQVFMKDNKRWPAKIEELESFNNKRYLRKRFRDPMTGKDEWRVIHIANGVLTDSLVTKAPTANDGKSADTYKWGASQIGVTAGIAGNGATNTGQNGVNLANRRRSSDTMAPGVTIPVGDAPGDNGQNPGGSNPGGMPGMPGAPMQVVTNAQGTATAGVPGMPGMPPGVQGPTGMPPGVPGVPGVPGQTAQGQQGQPTPTQTQTPGVVGVPGQAGQQAFVYNTGMASQPQAVPQGQIQPGQNPTPYQPGVYQPPVNSQMGGVSPQYPTTAGANGVPPNYAQPGSNINPQQMGNQAQQMIQQILTSPRPGGAPVAGGAVAGAMGAGIAGFASNVDADSIKTYNDHTNYKEWEFVFDPTKVKPLPNPLSGANGTPASQMGSMGGSPAGTPVGQSPSPFGGMPGAQPGGFGSSPMSPMPPTGPRQPQ